MSKWMALGFVACGCGGGVIPEQYLVTIDYILAPPSCYPGGTAPQTEVTQDAPSLARIRVWDGPESKAYLAFDSGAPSIDMGSAPSVPAPDVMEGTGAAGSASSTFAVDHTEVDMTPVIKISRTSHLELKFTRGDGFKGTLNATSAVTCEGSVGCPTMNPSCMIGPVNFKGTRLYVENAMTVYPQ